jgi:SAM-dependent methyltransferase
MFPVRVRAFVKATLSRAGLLNVVRHIRDRLWEREFSRGNRAFLKNGSPDGLPIPPVSLRILVAASPDIPWFFDSGRRAADSVRGILERNGIPLERVRPILDFGCGCGRTVRHFAALGNDVFGSDLNKRLIEWCQERLPFGRYAVNPLAPPVPFGDEQFGLVYALSVFTHLPAELQLPWMNELRRVLKPDGYLVITTHGSRYLSELESRDQNRFRAGELVVTRHDSAASNVCGAYHPEPYVRNRLSRGFRVVDFVPEGASGNPWQDLWLLQRLD